MRSGASRAALPDRIAKIRAEAAKHQAELEAMRWLTVDKLARRWGVAPKTVRKIPRESLPYMTVGGGEAREHRRYNPADVETYEAQQRNAGAA